MELNLIFYEKTVTDVLHNILEVELSFKLNSYNILYLIRPATEGERSREAFPEFDDGLHQFD